MVRTNSPRKRTPKKKLGLKDLLHRRKSPRNHNNNRTVLIAPQHVSGPKKTVQNEAKPLTPRVLIRPYKSHGFLDPPVTISIDDDLPDSEANDKRSIKRKINKAVNGIDEEGLSKPCGKRRRFNDTIEDGEIRDAGTEDEDEIIFIGEMPGQKNVNSNFTPRRSHRFRPSFAKLVKKIRGGSNKKKTRQTRWDHDSTNIAKSPKTLLRSNDHVNNFQPNAAPCTNFTSGMSQIQGGVFEFSASSNSKRIVPKMGTSNINRSNTSIRPSTSSLGNIYVPRDSVNSFHGLRPIVIDGSNVAYAHGTANNYKPTFSARGIDICIDYFKRRGHEVVAFVPRRWLKAGQSSDTHILHRLERSNHLIITPSGECRGKRFSSYDDRFIVQYAAVKKGIIVSNDNYKDLLDEDRDMREAIEERLLRFTWCQNILMFAQDPMGKLGKNLDQFLKF